MSNPVIASRALQAMGTVLAPADTSQDPQLPPDLRSLRSLPATPQTNPTPQGNGNVVRLPRRPTPPHTPCEFCGVRMGLHPSGPGACDEARLREDALDEI